MIDVARKLLATDIDPGEHSKVMKTAIADRAANSFGLVAREWLPNIHQIGCQSCR